MLTQEQGTHQTRVSPPLTLLRYHVSMIGAWSRVYAKSALSLRPDQNPVSFKQLRTKVQAIDDDLVTAYIDWCGGDGKRYANHIPPHLFSQWGLPLAIRLIEQSRYNVKEIINQGVSFKVHGPLPTGQQLIAKASMQSVEESGGRANLAIKVITGTKEQPCLLEATLFSTFILEQAGRAINLRATKPLAGSEWVCEGEWDVCPDDGFKFAVLTGDFNPIHWIDSVGRKSPFGGTVLQGFGALARCFEQIAATRDITEFDVQFQRPIFLKEEKLFVETAPASAEGWNVLRLIDGNRKVRISGKFK